MGRHLLDIWKEHKGREGKEGILIWGVRSEGLLGGSWKCKHR
jgi:hypothetical protein